MGYVAHGELVAGAGYRPRDAIERKRPRMLVHERLRYDAQPRGQRASRSRPADAATAGRTGTTTPDSTHAFWLGAKRGASSPSLISRVTAKRLNCVAGINKRSLFGKPSEAVSTSPSAAEMTPSPLVSTRATSTAYASNRRFLKSVTVGSNEISRSYRSRKTSLARPLGMKRWRNSRCDSTSASNLSGSRGPDACSTPLVLGLSP